MTGYTTLLGRAMCLCVLTGLAVSPLHAQYRVTDLAPLSYAVDINSQGQVVGWGWNWPDSCFRAFLWTGPGTTTAIPRLGTGDRNYAYGLNDLGVVVGSSAFQPLDSSGYGASHAYRYAAGTVTDLTPSSSSASAKRINAAGSIVGTDSVIGGFVIPVGLATMFPLPSLSGSGTGTPADINANNWIVGTSALPFTGIPRQHATAWVFDASTGRINQLIDLDRFSPNTDSEARAVNAANHVVGGVWPTSSYSTAFIWRDGWLTTISGGASSMANDINASDVVVGEFNTGGPLNENHAFVSFNASSLVDLNTMIPGNPGWKLQRASGINDAGQVIGTGINPQGSAAAFLLTPNKPPTAVADALSVRGGANAVVNVTGNDTDPEHDTLKVTAVGAASLGTTGLSGTTSVFYTARPFAGGADSFSYSISDGYGGTASGTVAATVYATDVTSEVKVSLGPLQLDKKTGRYTQTASVKNVGTRQIPFTASLALTSLSANATLYNKAGLTTYPGQANRPVVNLAGGTDTLLSPGETISAKLEFVLTSGNSVTFTPQVLAGAGDR